MASVTVHQLTSKSDKNYSFLNVEEEYGNVQVWGSIYNRPTYLLQDSNLFYLIQFDDQNCADEFFEEKGSSFVVTKIEEKHL
jgi:hypothetical protein